MSPAALIVVEPAPAEVLPNINEAAFKSTLAVDALPIVVVPRTPAALLKVPICLMVSAAAAFAEALIDKPSRGVVTPIVPRVIAP